MANTEDSNILRTTCCKEETKVLLSKRDFLSPIPIFSLVQSHHHHILNHHCYHHFLIILDHIQINTQMYNFDEIGS